MSRQFHFSLLLFLFALTCKAQVDSTKINEASRINFDLKGRQAIKVPSNVTDSFEKGIVVVEITVDSNGKVIKAKPGIVGSTTSSITLFAKARQATYQTIFSKADNLKEQIGTMTIAIDLKH